MALPYMNDYVLPLRLSATGTEVNEKLNTILINPRMQETEVLAALLAGARVRVERDALEYRRYRRTAPLGIYQNCAGLERRLREMGICVAGTGGR